MDEQGQYAGGPTPGDGVPPLTPPPWTPPTWTPPSFDVLAGGPGTPYDSAPVVGGSRRRGRILAAGLAVVLVLTGAAGYAAWSALSGGGSQPEDVLPADTIAFVKVDLDPPAGQKVEVYRLLQRFPHLTKLTGSDADMGDWLVHRFSDLAGAGMPGLDVDKDVKPWLGQRVAVAAVPAAGAAGAEAVVVVQETDDKAATAAMHKLERLTGQPIDFATSHGYLVVSSGHGAAADVASAERAPLAKAPQFAADVASLHSDQLVTAWGDLGRAGKTLTGALGAAGLAGGPGGLFGNAWQGRFVLGLHVTDGMLELQVRTFGGKPARATPPVGPLTDLVPGAVAVLSVSGAADGVDAALGSLGSIPGYEGLGGNGPVISRDLRTLLGTRLTVSVGGTAQQPAVVAASHSDAPEAALAALHELVRLGGVDMPPLATRTTADTLYVGSSAQAVDSAGKGNLLHPELYQRAVVDADHAQAVGFVDLGRLWELSAQTGDPVDPELRQLAAAGFSSVTNGGDTAVTVRLVFT